MSINPQDYVSQPNNWFDTDPQYEGEGYAEFERPFGHIKGQAKVHLNIAGLTQVVMEIEKFNCEEAVAGNFSSKIALIWLLSGRKPIQANGLIQYNSLYTSVNNTCSLLTITTNKGIFKATGNISYLEPPMLMGETKVKILFYVTSSEYNQFEVKEAKFWVMPLTNFVSSNLKSSFRFLERHPLDQHILRIFPTKFVPDNLSQEDELKALLYATQSRCIIPFEYQSELGFIERLSDYHERSEKLQTGKSNLLITAVMVGTYLMTPGTSETIFDWLPVHYLHLLSLASGSLIGSPWVEIRSESGELVSRIHKSIWINTYAKGHETINNQSEKGIGVLLSDATSKEILELQTAIRLVVKGGQDIFDIEDKLAFFFRAADTLTKELRQKTKALERTDLEPRLKEEIRTLLKETGKKINNLDQANNTAETKKEKNRIAQNVYQAENQAPKKHDEAEALELLATQQGLQDFPLRGIFDVQLKNELNWHQLYKTYRNQVIHEGNLSKEHNYKEFYPLYYHLGDVLVRVILKLLRYDGEYKRFIPGEENISVDWVTKQTRLTQLWRIPPFD